MELPNQERLSVGDGTYISDRRAAKRRMPVEYMLIDEPKLQQDLNQLGVLAAGHEHASNHLEVSVTATLDSMAT